MSQPPLTLVLLAAGLGSRFGGLKQLEAVDPNGNTLLDYTLYDACRAGIRRAVLVIRADMPAAWRTEIRLRAGSRLEVAFAEQRGDDVPAGHPAPPDRSRPWGTGHAVLAVRREVTGPFLVANADDHYGPESLRIAADFLRGSRSGDEHALVAFALRETLSASGGVSRAVCEVASDGRLVGLRELPGLRRRGDDAEYDSAQGAQRVPGDTPVSMNLWAFGPSIFDGLMSRFVAFLAAQATSTEAEFYLPTAVHELLSARQAIVHVLQSADPWCGLTYAADREIVRGQIAKLRSARVYPEPLWQPED